MTGKRRRHAPSPSRNLIDNESKSDFQSHLVDQPPHSIIPYREQPTFGYLMTEPMHISCGITVGAARIDDFTAAAETSDHMRDGLPYANHNVRLHDMSMDPNR